MGTISVIIAMILVVVYITCAIMFIRNCETAIGTVCATVTAVGIGGLLAYFIEYLVAIAVCGIVLAIIGAIAD